MQALWRALDDDSSGFIMSGEFSKFMRLGYDEMLKEQERIKSKRSRPVWMSRIKMEHDKPNFKELQAERLRLMHESLRSKISHLEAESAKLEAEAKQAEAQLRRIPGAKPSPRGPPSARGLPSPRSGAPSPRGGPAKLS